jgi:cobalt-zinc-cadmium resistance protein CzcA
MVVFLPLLTLQGLEGKLFAPVAITITFALGTSLLLALTVIPVLSSYFLKSASHTDPWLVRKLNAAYTRILDWSLAHVPLVIAAATASLVVASLAYLQLGKTFLPAMDEGDIVIQTEKLPSISLEQSINLDGKVQQAVLAKVPEIRSIVSRTGSDEIGLDPMGLNQTDNFLALKPREDWESENKELLIEKIRHVIDGFPGLVFSFTQPIEMRVSEMLTGVRGDVAIKIFGTDLATLNQKASEIAAVVEAIPGAQDVYTARNEGAQYLRIALDRLAIGRLGLTIDTIEDILRAQIEGTQIGTIYEGQRRTALIVRGEAGLRTSPAEFANLMLTLPNGQNIPLAALAKLERTDGPVMINREHGSRVSMVIANVSGRDLVGFVDEARARVGERVKLPAEYYLEWGGQFENQQRASARLAVVLPIAVGLIFLLLFTTFHSVRQAGLVLTNIPFALVGGVFGLWITGEYLSVPASVGFIALLGIAVLNGVVLVTYFNQLRAIGKDIEHVIIEGAHRRLRPVLMTASIAAFGLMPLLFATGPGSEIQRPLAIVVIGGLVTSTLLTLVLLPILYRRFGAG